MSERTVSRQSPTRRELLRGGLTFAAVAGAAPILSACGGGGGDGGGSDANGVVTITMWHGQADQGKETLDKLVAEFNPDIAYIFGPDIASLARSRAVADLSSYTSDPGVRWNDFWQAAREAVTVDGKPRGFPALLDNLCVAYNKTVFAQAGIPAPKVGWTWDDFVDIAPSPDQSRQGRLRHRLARGRRRGLRLAHLADGLGPGRRRGHPGPQADRLRQTPPA